MKARFGHLAVEFGEGIRNLAQAGFLDVETITPALEQEAWAYFKRFREQRRLSYADCTSFAVMVRRNIQKVFSEDEHFEKVNLGFVRLAGDT